MFDLNQAIRAWVDQLAQGETCRKTDLDELEGHLREEIQQLRGSCPLSEEEAFLVATHRLGDAGSLSREFRKINPHVLWGRRLLWAASGLYAFLMMKYLLGAVASACVWVGFQAGLAAPWLGWINIAAKATLLASALALFYGVFRLDALGAVSRWRRMNEGFKRRWVLIAASAVLVSLLVFPAHLATQFLLTRSLSVSEYGETLLVPTYVNLAWSVLLPAVLAYLILRRLMSDRTAGLHRA